MKYCFKKEEAEQVPDAETVLSAACSPCGAGVRSGKPLARLPSPGSVSFENRRAGACPFRACSVGTWECAVQQSSWQK